MTDVFITGVGKCLPGEPVSNDEIGSIIGKISDRSDSLGTATLRKNGIKKRYYALTASGNYTHTNAQMAAEAIHDAFAHAKRSPDNADYLATSTTQGDYLVPGFASAVHGELGIPPLELASFQSVCASSLMAAKSAWLAVRTHEARLAVASGSEFSSRWFQPGFYQPFYNEDSRPDPELEFLRWTLSDGAGAVVFEPEPKATGISLRVDWIKQKSFADRFPPCMYAGAATNKAAKNQPWNLYNSPAEAYQAGAIALKQDFTLLYKMFPAWVGYYLELLDNYQLDPNGIDYFLPHYSAQSLGQEMKKLLIKTGAMIPEERWFSNLVHCGNTGTASIFIMLDELVKAKPLTAGQKILCFVPESGRGICSFMHLSVFDNN
ncbi:beta-ketoacyl-ACP synthase III [Endozoicomonas sp. SM1973]|uniref:Beta-ketoacyl-ACP synthase III n=1 Tax=Spartinivicinus marinus TaxID=2994442 RepID=A0A853IAP1_9GAMM|nr:beta-ketoacyl-ACP synthase III [Spartinivicinus marinus]MCX4028629.1 beta-ketoacyl-ACP synthase III [Spartinivicinus marinus]NYZ67104.1 beta-ketoacyl-ACP synthase III [Spartinivicinus marinus]